MVALKNGHWSQEPVSTSNEKGEFVRKQSQFRDTINPQDVAPGRFHLYVSYACPWAHRTLIVRSLKKLDKLIPFSVTNAFMGDRGWTFGSGHDQEFLADVYRGADAHYTGKVTVPVLWDNRKDTIVNNESSEIIRILNTSFNNHTDSLIDFYPQHLQEEIDEMNERIYEPVNNGVYKAGFAQTQGAYNQAVKELFKTLDEMDGILGERKFLLGDKITEADIRFFTTLIRFDLVYYVHFKCNLRLIKDYPNLSEYLRSLYQIPEIKSTCHFDHIKEHYYTSHRFINPHGIIPIGPQMDLNAPHSRGKPDFFQSVRSGNLS